MEGASPIFRILLIAGWALGIVSLVADVGALAIPGGALIAAAGVAMLAGGGPERMPSPGAHRLFGPLMIFIGLCWVGYGIASV
jgi:hypothetical protein